MKKYISIGISIIILIIAIVLICTNKSKIIYQNIYQGIVNIKDVKDNVSFESENLRVTLKGVYTDRPVKEEMLSTLEIEENSTIDNIIESYNENDINIILEFSGCEGTFITELDYGYIIYDNNENILAYSTGFLFNEKEFEKKFMKEQYNTNSFYELTQHIVDYGQKWDITYSNNKILNSINSRLTNTDVNLDLSKLHILLIHPRYKDTKSNQYHNLDNTVFELIVEN